VFCTGKSHKSDKLKRGKYFSSTHNECLVAKVFSATNKLFKHFYVMEFFFILFSGTENIFLLKMCLILFALQSISLYIKEKGQIFIMG
jgi:hypothetical protein